MPDANLALLQLLQLTDSALPVGAQSHSFGLESLVADGLLTIATLEPFLTGYLHETGTAESYFCRAAYQLATRPDEAQFAQEWLELNERLSAFRPARESRAASAALARRLLTLATSLAPAARLRAAHQAVQSAQVELHYVTVLGLIAGLLALGEQATTLALLQQSVMGLLAAMQKLLPVGQTHVAALLWRLKPAMLAAAERSAAMNWPDDSVTATTPLLELAALRHARLPVRLFIS